MYAVLSRPLEADSVGAEHWLSVEPVQIARYLTLSDERLYQSVGHGHLLSYVWGHDSAEGATEGASKQPLLQLTQRFNEVASIVKSAIIGTSMLATRTQLVAHLVAVGVELRRLANFNSVMALIAALGSAAVHRLSGTKQKLDRKSRAAWESLTELMAHDGAHRQYRAAARPGGRVHGQLDGLPATAQSVVTGTARTPHVGGSSLVIGVVRRAELHMWDLGCAEWLPVGNLLAIGDVLAQRLNELCLGGLGCELHLRLVGLVRHLVPVFVRDELGHVLDPTLAGCLLPQHDVLLARSKRRACLGVVDVEQDRVVVHTTSSCRGERPLLCRVR